MANGFGRRLFCVLLVLCSAQVFALGSRHDPDWQKRWWLDKTVRKFRGGEGLLPNEDAEALLSLSKEEVVALLIADPRFANMVLDFNMYFLGFKTDQLKSEGEYNENIYDFPAAITSARETFANGDYFRLFDLHAMPYMKPLRVPYREQSEEKLSNRDVILRRAASTQKSLKEIIDYLKNDPTATAPEACRRFYGIGGAGALYQLGTGSSFQSKVDTDFDYSLNLEGACFLGMYPPLPQMTAYFEKINEINEKLFPALMSYEESLYYVSGLQDMRIMDVSAMGFSAPWIAWGAAQRRAVVNSSTNFNRKRAAYVLKRFFCDDLTPIQVESPQAHASGGPHGSQTSCYACHYKLDPMAGFFRDYGLQFADFSQYPVLVFDDLAMVPREDYARHWQAPAGTKREWNVGYIRSVSDEALNDYGSTLADLHALLKRAPEVKRCLSRKAFEYMVSDKQTIDAGYLDYLTEEFTQRASVNSAMAFKWLVSTLALSNSFNEPDIAADECYDHRPGTIPGSRPPCRVAFVFERNCVSCHSSTSGAGRLNLAGWVMDAGGKMTFPHLNRAGAQRPARETFEKIVDRLSTRDESRRMPLGIFMSSQDRQELYLWAQEQLK